MRALFHHIKAIELEKNRYRDQHSVMILYAITQLAGTMRLWPCEVVIGMRH